MPDTGADDAFWMREALALARQAAALGEAPVGAIVVRDGQALAQAFNLRETLHDPTAHAERIALELAGRSVGRWRLDEATMYVTLEPCTMCAGALVLARVKTLVFGAFDPKAGACGSLYDIVRDPRLNHRLNVRSEILAEECGAILTDFFRARRARPERYEPEA